MALSSPALPCLPCLPLALRKECVLPSESLQSSDDTPSPYHIKSCPSYHACTVQSSHITVSGTPKELSQTSEEIVLTTHAPLMPPLIMFMPTSPIPSSMKRKSSKSLRPPSSSLAGAMAVRLTCRILLVFGIGRSAKSYASTAAGDEPVWLRLGID